MNVLDFIECILRPSLKSFGFWSIEAEKLLLGTAIQETRLIFLRQRTNKHRYYGPGFGPFSMEPRTHNDIYLNYLRYRPERLAKVEAFLIPEKDKIEQLAYNFAYATVMARLQYLRYPDKIPNDLWGQALLWKKRYNSPIGRGTPEEYVSNYKRTMSNEIYPG